MSASPPGKLVTAYGSASPFLPTAHAFPWVTTVAALVLRH
ncbi:hypothetical protein M2271_000888 [Streptomyces sp. LBL]|nr:hypothetical protein [Streptomyces sp. LBL]